MKDETGNRYSRLSVICLSYVDIKGLAFWECKCDCGNVITVAGSALRSGNTKSSGCLLHDVLVCRNETHVKYGTKQYRANSNMVSRVDHPKSSFYDNYGGRGISYTPKWKTFDGFWEDMWEGYSEELTLDRRDVNGDYCKENCRWATEITQSRNKAMFSSNTSGVTGVHFATRDSAWVAKISSFNGRKLRKQFSTAKFGNGPAFAMACAWRDEQKRILEGSCYEYGEEHGR